MQNGIDQRRSAGLLPEASAALRDKGLLPAVHLVDTGYLDTELLVTAKRARRAHAR